MTETAKQEQSSQPLFFKDPIPLLKDRHADSGVKKNENYSFAANTNTIPLNVTEFIEAAKFYPIVFSAGENPTPLAIVGAEQDKNIFVNKAGEWRKDVYIPAYARRYPFAFSGEGEKLTLCVDEGSEIFVKTAKKKDLYFFANGEQTNLTKSALSFCTQYHKDSLMTQAFGKELKAKGLLKERTLTINLEQMKKPLSVSGFQTIDEDAFRALPKDVVCEWHQSGLLSLVYSHFLSSSNWQRVAEKLA